VNDEIVSLLLDILQIGAVEIYTCGFAPNANRHTMVVLRTQCTTRVSSAEGTDAEALHEALGKALENHHYQEMLLDAQE